MGWGGPWEQAPHVHGPESSTTVDELFETEDARELPPVKVASWEEHLLGS